MYWSSVELMLSVRQSRSHRNNLICQGSISGPPSIASKIKFALFFANCDILRVKIIRIDSLEPNIWLYCVYYAVLAAVF